MAVINQVIRGLQVKSGYGIKHVAMFADWAIQFYEKGMGGTPAEFLPRMANAFGPRWREFLDRRDPMREEMGLGSMYPSEQAAREMRVLMDETGFTARLAAMGAPPHAGAAPRRRPLPRRPQGSGTPSRPPRRRGCPGRLRRSPPGPRPRLRTRKSATLPEVGGAGARRLGPYAFSARSWARAFSRSAWAAGPSLGNWGSIAARASTTTADTATRANHL